MKILLIFGLLAAVKAKLNCTSQTINISGSWSLPLSSLEDKTFCTVKFNFSTSYFAYMELQANGINNSDSNLGYDTVQIDLVTGFGGTHSYSPYNESSYTSKQAWAGPFQIFMRTNQKTAMNLQIIIVLYPNNVGKKIAGSFNVGKDMASSLLYFSDLQEGATYLINGETDVSISAGLLETNYNTSYSLGNLFLYNGNKLIGTVQAAYGQQSNPSGFRLYPMMKLYVARKTEIIKGAMVFNDYSNLINLYQAFTVYLPLNQAAQTTYFYLYSHYKDQMNQDGSLTIIGDKDGSTPFDIREFAITQDLGGAYFMTAAGGVQYSHRTTATTVNPRQVPQHFIGNLNTVYIAHGSGRVKVTVSN